MTRMAVSRISQNFCMVGLTCLALFLSACGDARAKRILSANRTLPDTGTTSLLDVTDISAGFQHTCAVVAGGVKCWGSNSQGQVGDGTLIDAALPVTSIAASSGVTQISSGEAHTCAVVSGGLQCWGDNSAGQLGDGTGIDSTTPVVAFPPGSGVIQVATGSFHTCAVVGADLYCWGANGDYQLGDGTNTQRLAPGAAIISLTVDEVAVGSRHSCVRIGATLKCWGRNSYGQLGDGGTTSTPPASPASGIAAIIGAGVTKIAAGASHTCAVVSGGLQCWGLNDPGQVGDGTGASSAYNSTPTSILAPATGATDITAGAAHTCAIVNGGMKCWGFNLNGELGDGTLTTRTSPIDTITAGSGVQKISSGGSHTCAITTGTALCWGSDSSGQLGE